MLGAISGDIIGSPYEFTLHNIKTKEFPLFGEKSKFTDDTVMTVASTAPYPSRPSPSHTAPHDRPRAELGRMNSS